MFDVDLIKFEVFFEIAGETDSAAFRAEDEQHAADLCIRMYPDAKILMIDDQGAAFWVQTKLVANNTGGIVDPAILTDLILDEVCQVLLDEAQRLDRLNRVVAAQAMETATALIKRRFGK